MDAQELNSRVRMASDWPRQPSANTLAKQHPHYEVYFELSFPPRAFRLAFAHLNLKLSRFNWASGPQPISFMSRSISAWRFLSALSTPACPPAARAYK